MWRKGIMSLLSNSTNHASKQIPKHKRGHCQNFEKIIAFKVWPPTFPKPSLNIREKIVSEFSKVGEGNLRSKNWQWWRKYQKWYFNWLWPPSLVTMKKYKNSIDVVNYLKRVYKDPRYMTSLYDKFGQGTVDNWFTTQGEFKLHVPQMVEHSHFWAPCV